MSTQNTLVFQVDTQNGKALSDALTRANYEFRTVPHAHYQARGEGITATWYRSGKLVVQGRGLEAWATRFLPSDSTPQASKQDRKYPLPDLGDKDCLGSDEAGKGDSFGALVVCAVAVGADQQAGLKKAGITDSKQLSDERIHRLAPTIADRFEHELRCLEPSEYNEEHRRHGSNVNRLLTQLHADVLESLNARTGFETAVVDAFGVNCPVQARLRKKHPQLKVFEIPRAERQVAVAAASILARDAFVKNLAKLSEHWAVDLPKGSGSPVGPALRRFLRIHSPDALGQVAKLHFRNVQAALES